VADDPNEASAHNNRGRVLADQERFDDAIEEYRQADELWQKKRSKDRKRALCNWADALRLQEHYDQAAEKCLQAIGIDPEFPDAHNSFGLVHAAQERFDDAIEEYRQADELWQKQESKDRKRALRNWADALRKQDHYEQAAEKCQQAIGIDPEFPDAYNSFGLVREAQERFDDAIELYRQADELWQKQESKDRKRALCNWADALRLQEHYDQAVEKCLQAIGIDPEFPDAYNSFGLVRAAQERFDDAIGLYRQADKWWRKKESKNRKRALWNWAHALSTQKHYEQAAEKCREAIDLDPHDPWGYFCSGRVRAMQERFDDAIEQYRQADERWQKQESKDRKYALLYWASALGEQEHYEQAVEKCLKAIGIDPEFPDAYNRFGSVRAAQERFDDAIELYRQADERWQKKESKRRKDALWNWAAALIAQKHHEQAVQKCREAIDLDPHDPWGYFYSGQVRAMQERFDDAIEQYRQADERWQKKGSKDRKYALWHWGWVLREQEKFEDAKTKFDCAQEIIKGDAEAVFHYGVSLTDLGQYQDAMVQFDKASVLDKDDPLPRHWKADLLFRLGCYEEGWKGWWAARQCYERLLDGELRGAERLRKALYLAGVLAEVFESYEESDKLYKRVLERQNSNADAWAGRAILNQQWANSDAKKPAEIHARLNYLMPRASELLKRQLGKGIDFQTHLALAALYLESCNWTEAREQLDFAESACRGSRLKHAQVTELRGLACYHNGEHSEAVKHFRQALLVKPGDLTLQSNLGNALLLCKKFESAETQFEQVLKFAPGNIDALRGAAQVCIELADDGDPDQYEIAVQFLTKALEYGRNRESGSKHLSNSDLAKIYYTRGYARTKSYEAGASPNPLIASLKIASDDFRKCNEADPNDSKARTAIEKINKRKRKRRGEFLVEVLGPAIIFCLSVLVFLFAQLAFLRSLFYEPPVHALVKDQWAYFSLTFTSLLFMIAAAYLPQLLKLKLPGIELEKAAVGKVSAPSIEISRPARLIRPSASMTN